MGTIIGDGVTFDDVLLVPQYSEVIPNPGIIEDKFDQEDSVEHSYDECGNGYGNRVSHGNCDGKDRVVLELFTRICLLRHRLMR